MKKLFVAAVLAVAPLTLSACAPAAEPVQAAPAPATTQVAAPATTTPEPAKPAAAGECASITMLPNRHVSIDPLPGVTFTKLTSPGAPRRDWPKGAEVQGMLTQFPDPGEVVIEGMGPNGPCRQVFKVT